jgi:hypothetical protein
MARVLNPGTWPEWQSEIVRVTGPPRVEEGDQVSGEAKLVGFEVQGRSDAHAVSDRVFIEDVIVGVRMVVTYEVEPSATGTKITHTLETDLPRGPLGWVLSLALRVKLRRMQRRVLSELAAQAEADASVA